jgi:hypothetical protein
MRLNAEQELWRWDTLVARALHDGHAGTVKRHALSRAGRWCQRGMGWVTRRAVAPRRQELYPLASGSNLHERALHDLMIWCTLSTPLLLCCRHLIAKGQRSLHHPYGGLSFPRELSEHGGTLLATLRYARVEEISDPKWPVCSRCQRCVSVLRSTSRCKWPGDDEAAEVSSPEPGMPGGALP